MKNISEFSRIEKADLELARKRLRSIHLVGLTENTKGSLNMMAKAMGVEPPKAEIHVNKNSFQYGLDARMDWVSEILSDFCSFDDALYADVCEVHKHQISLFE